MGPSLPHNRQPLWFDDLLCIEFEEEFLAWPLPPGVVGTVVRICGEVKRSNLSTAQGRFRAVFPFPYSWNRNMQATSGGFAIDFVYEKPTGSGGVRRIFPPADRGFLSNR